MTPPPGASDDPGQGTGSAAACSITDGPPVQPPLQPPAPHAPPASPAPPTSPHRPGSAPASARYVSRWNIDVALGTSMWHRPQKDPGENRACGPAAAALAARPGEVAAGGTGGTKVAGPAGSAQKGRRKAQEGRRREVRQQRRVQRVCVGRGPGLVARAAARHNRAGQRNAGGSCRSGAAHPGPSWQPGRRHRGCHIATMILVTCRPDAHPRRPGRPQNVRPPGYLRTGIENDWTS